MFGNDVDAAPVLPSNVNRGAFTQQRGDSSIQLFRNSIPTADNFDKLTQPIPGAKDVIYHEYYDSVQLTSASAQTGTFFVTSQANIYNGNLLGANGRLQSDERFLVTAVRFEVENADTSNPLDVVDVKEIFRLGTYQFNVSNKTYNSGKLMRFLNPVATFIVNTNYYAVNPFQSWKLPLPVAIGSNMGFNVEFTVTNPTLGSTSRLFVYLCGFLYRNVQ